MTNTEIVNSFIASWKARNVDAIMAFLADGATYHNMPMLKLTGHKQIRAFIAPFFDKTEWVSLKVLHSAENVVGTVLNERVDRFVLKTGKELYVEVMGTFELVDGKISAWRDNFDLKTFTDQKAE